MSRQQKALSLMSKQGQFQITNVPIPKPKPGEVLVKIQATALNPMEYKIQELGMLVQDYPAILGIDAAGDIEELGEGVKGVSKGDRVLVQTLPPGDYASYQQYVLVPADAVTKIPSKFSYAEASTIPTTFLTAASGLLAEKPEGAGLNPTLDPNVKFSGQPALVMGGSTSVGQFAIQILKYLDFSPIVTYAGAKHTDFLKNLGATHVIDRYTVPVQDVPSAFRNITSAPLNIAYVSMGGQEAADAAWACLSAGGQLPSAIHMNPPEPVDGKRSWFVWGSCYFRPAQASLHKDLVPKTSPFGLTIMPKITEWLEEGVITPNKVQILPNGLAGIVSGHEEQRNDRVSGFKLVVLPQDTP